MSILGRIKRLLPPRSPLRLLWHWVKSFVAALCCGFPARRLTIIGITGTDGKTTTVAMTAHILHACGVPVGAVSTSFFRIGAVTEENPTHKTSLSPLALQRFLRRCVREGCTTVVVEASSHGLVQHRLDFLWPAVAGITNTALEHLDYHGTMEQYRKDKGILFQMLRGKGTKVLNAEDETFDQYSRISSVKTIVFGSGERLAVSGDSSTLELWTSDIEVNTKASTAIVHVRDHYSLSAHRYPLSLLVSGVFSIKNALCAISCAHAAGVPIGDAVRSLADFPGVPGRMEWIECGQAFGVFVDFTVSPQAYVQTLTTARKLITGNGRLLVLTGSCGDRMREKRPMIGKIVSSLADVVVVSEDETVTEDQHKVIDEVWSGIDQATVDAHRIFDRREAIRFLFAQAKPGDIVALCGMGACTTMQTREGLREWDEREIARELLKELIAVK